MRKYVYVLMVSCLSLWTACSEDDKGTSEPVDEAYLEVGQDSFKESSRTVECIRCRFPPTRSGA